MGRTTNKAYAAKEKARLLARGKRQAMSQEQKNAAKEKENLRKRQKSPVQYHANMSTRARTPIVRASGRGQLVQDLV